MPVSSKPYPYIPLTLNLMFNSLCYKMNGSLTLSLLKAAALYFIYGVSASVLVVGVVT